MSGEEQARDRLDPQLAAGPRHDLVDDEREMRGEPPPVVPGPTGPYGRSRRRSADLTCPAGRRPEPGGAPQRVSGRARAAGVRHYLAAGLLEPPFLRATRRWAQRLRRAGLDVRLEAVHGGHDDL